MIDLEGVLYSSASRILMITKKFVCWSDNDRFRKCTVQLGLEDSYDHQDTRMLD
jgi:hypothetical protein